MAVNGISFQCTPDQACCPENNVAQTVHTTVDHPLADLRFLSNPLRLGWQRGFLPYQDRLDIRDLLFFQDPDVEDLVFRSKRFKQTAIVSPDQLTFESLKEVYEQALRHLFPGETSIQILPDSEMKVTASFSPEFPDNVFVNFSDSTITAYQRAMSKDFPFTLEELVAATLTHELVHRKQYLGPPGSSIEGFVRRLISGLKEEISVGLHSICGFSDQELNNLLLENYDYVISFLENNPDIQQNENKLNYLKNFIAGLIVKKWGERNIGTHSSSREKQTIETWSQWLNKKKPDNLLIEQEAHRVSALICPFLVQSNLHDGQPIYRVYYDTYDQIQGFSRSIHIETLPSLAPTWGRRARRFVSELETNHRNVRGVGLLVDSAANLMFGLDWVNYFSERNNSECPGYSKNFDLGIALLSTATTGAWGASIFGKTRTIKAMGSRASGSLGALTGLVASFKDFVVDWNDDKTTTAKTAFNALDIVANAMILGGSLYFGIEGGTMGRLAPLASTMIGTAMDIGAKIAKSFC